MNRSISNHTVMWLSFVADSNIQNIEIAKIFLQNMAPICFNFKAMLLFISTRNTILYNKVVHYSIKISTLSSLCFCMHSTVRPSLTRTLCNMLVVREYWGVLRDVCYKTVTRQSAYREQMDKLLIFYTIQHFTLKWYEINSDCLYTPTSSWFCLSNVTGYYGFSLLININQ